MRPNFQRESVYINGKYYRLSSSYEINFALYLGELQRRGIISWFIKNTAKFPFSSPVFLGDVTRNHPDYSVNSYIPDFIVFDEFGYEIVEIKGWQVDKWERQYEQFKKDYPGVEVQIVGKAEMLELQKEYSHLEGWIKIR